MRVALVTLTSGGLSGGFQKYLGELIPKLLMHPRLDDLQVFCPSWFMAQIAAVVPRKNCHPCEDTISGRLRLRKALTRISPDVLFFPSLRGVSVGRIPTVYMIHNMEPLARPFDVCGLKEAVKNLGRHYAAKIACQRATRIIAVSAYVRDFLIETWNISPAKIGMVYHGVQDSPPPETLAIPKGIPSDWTGRFLFTAGSIRPARGLEDIIQAMAILVSQGIMMPLVVAGAAEPSCLPYQQKMVALSQKLGIQDQVLWAAQLTPGEMSWCYHHARMFVMTSRVEACPIIALEAMSHGSGCIVAHNPPLPEFFLDAALYYLPGDCRSLAEAIGTYQASSPEAQKSLRRRAQTHAARFTWGRTADETLKELMLARESYKS